jgi:hypothetical protein
MFRSGIWWGLLAVSAFANTMLVVVVVNINPVIIIIIIIVVIIPTSPMAAV